MKKIWNWIKSNPTYFLLFIFVLVCIVLVKIFIPLKEGGFGEGVLVESFGLLFDILLLGIMGSYFLDKRQQKLEKKLKIERYKEEIEDYLGWDEKEAMYRIVGNIKRLNRYNVNNINLRKAFLKGANFYALGFPILSLKDAELWRANLENVKGGVGFGDNFHVDFSNAKCWKTKFNNADFEEGKFQKADLEEAELRKTHLLKANFKKANLRKANLEGATLDEANLEGATLLNTNLQNISFKGANLKKAVLKGADLSGTILSGANCEGTYFEFDFLENIGNSSPKSNVTLEQLLETKTLYNAEIDPDLRNEIEKRCPDLLKEP